MKERKNVIWGGSTGIVELLPCRCVLKSAYPDSDGRRQSLRDIEREFQIYQRLPRHDRLLQMMRYSPDEGLVLEYMPRGNLREHLRSAAATEIALPQRLQWACDAAEGLQVLHCHSVIHCDVKTENFLLDSALRLRIIDFSGSSIDGKWASAFEGARFCLPRSWHEPSTVATDLFALGSTMYEIMTGRQPYEELSDDDVEARYRQRLFPSVGAVPCGEVIMACWCGGIQSANEAMELIKARMSTFQKGI